MLFEFGFASNMEDTNDVMELQEQEKEIIDDIDSYIPQPKVIHLFCHVTRS